jgi:hypothetical protein
MCSQGKLERERESRVRWRKELSWCYASVLSHIELLGCEFYHRFETEFLVPKSRLQGSACQVWPNKEMNISEGQRKVYCAALEHCGKGQSQHFCPSLGTECELLV